MSVLESILRPRRASTARKRARSFKPSLDALEGRQLLSLYLRGTASGYPTAWDAAPDTQYLGAVSSNSYLDVKDPLTAVVDWGDGTAPDTVANAGIVWRTSFANYVNVPGHTFQNSGPLTIHVTVADQHGASVSWNDSFNVADAAVTFTNDEAVPVGLPNNVVGAKFRIDTLIASRDPATAIDGVVYSFTEPDGSAGGALAAPADGSLVMDKNGYHADEVRSDFGTKDAPTHTYIEDYWDATPGNHTVRTDIHWHNSKGLPFIETLTKTYNIQAPTGNLVATTSPNLAIRTFPLSGTYAIASGTLTTPGIKIDASIDPNSIVNTDGTIQDLSNSTYGIIQTVVTDSTRNLTGVPLGFRGMVARTDGTGPILDPSTTFLDCGPTFAPYYRFFIGNLKSDTPAYVGDGTTPNIQDTPQAPGVAGATTRRYDNFIDTLMFTPNGGIPVPIGKLTWNWGVTADFPMDKSKPVTTNQKLVTATQYEATSQLPSWQAFGKDYSDPTVAPSRWLPNWVPTNQPGLPQDLSNVVTWTQLYSLPFDQWLNVTQVTDDVRSLPLGDNTDNALDVMFPEDGTLLADADTIWSPLDPLV